MILISKKDHILPLSEKIKIQGFRIETSQRPSFLIKDHILLLSDTWKIQLAYLPLKQKESSGHSLFSEFSVAWEDSFDWKEDYPTHITAAYLKKPRGVAMHLSESADNRYTLHLSLEVPVSIDFLSQHLATVAKESPVQHTNNNPTAEEPAVDTKTALSHVFKQAQHKADSRFSELEKRASRLEKDIEELATRLHNVEASINSLIVYSRLNGTVLDSYRIIPIPNAIIEIYENLNDAPLFKTASDERGYYACERLEPGTYHIKIKHPRYLPLDINNYVIKKGENRSQDFLLRRH